MDSDTKFSDVDLWIYPVILLLFLVAILAVSYVVLSRDNQIRWYLPLIVAGAFVIVFGVSILNLIGLVLLILFSLYAIKVSEIEIRDRTKLHPGLAMRRGIQAIILPLLILISFAFYQSPSIQRQLSERDVPIGVRDAVIKAVNVFLEGEGESPDEAPDLQKEREFIASKAFDQMIESFFQFTDRYEGFLPPILAFGLFLALWGLSFIFLYASLGLAIALFWALKAIGFVHIETIEVKAEQLVL